MTVATSMALASAVEPDVADTFIFPASPAQQRLWLAADVDPTGAAYNVPHALAIDGPVDAGALATAIDAVVDRHEALRTTFTRGERGLVQVVRTHRRIPTDITDLGEGAADADVQSAVAAEGVRPFDLVRGPLIRLRLFRAGAHRTILCLTLHHLVCDGWSLDILSRELSRAYAAAAAGLRPNLGPAPLQYADFVVWQQERLEAEQARTAQFWSRELADLPPVLSWPADFVRPIAPTGRGGRVVRTLPDATTRAIQRLAREGGTTPFVVMLSMFAAFLGRWTGDRDVPIGTPVSGRDRPELEDVVGLFVNTVVPRFRLRSEASFRAVVADGRELMLQAMRHQAMPLEQAAGPLAAARVPGVTPLFQAMFAQQPAGGTAFVASAPCAPLRLAPTTAKFDLTLLAFDRQRGIDLAFDFNRDLFADATVHAALDALVTMLDAGTRAPETPIEQLPWMTVPALAYAVAHGVGAERVCPLNVPVHERFEAIAHCHARTTAIEDGLQTMTYGELDARADAIAGRLQEARIAAGDRVALLMGRGADCVAAMIGVLKAGGVYVPIDPSYPTGRIAFMLDDCDARAIITSGTAPVASDRPCIDVSTIAAARSHRPAPVDVDGGAPAYIIYTSGSTGTPKGVVIPHRAISRLVIDTDYVQVGTADRVAHASTVSFDAATFEVWGALLNGAALVIVPGDVMASAPAIGRWVRDRRLSVMFVTTAVFNRVAADASDAFAPLRVLLFGGEASDPRTVAAIVARGAPGTLLHVYGPTESTTFATSHRVTAVNPSAATVPIGRAIANTSAHLLDEHFAPVPQGVVGELFIGGDGLAIGYHRRPELTASRFIAGPFGGGRLYRTGDRCRVNAGGDIEFIGRADRQIKLRGFRIEPEEVERVLASHPSIAAAVVDVVGEGARRRLVACVTGAADLRADDVQRFAAARLPPFMVPSAIARVREVPLTANGKIDRERLASMIDEEEVPRRVRGARDPLEAELVGMWEQLLGTAPIGIDDDFFALGGHSLLAAAMIDRVEALFGWRVPIGTVLQHPTIDGLATAYWQLARAAETPLMTLRETGTRPPLFFIHGDLNGGGFYCGRLARALDVEQPFYALAPLRERDGRPPPVSIEAMAARYLEIIEGVRPSGPIALGGYCHGALVAFEIARRLAGTRSITTVAMVHPSPVEPRLAPVDAIVRMLCRARGSNDRARVAATVRLVQGLKFVREAAAGERAAWLRRKVAGWHRTASAGPPTADQELLDRGERHDADAWERNVRAVFAFVPRTYRRRVVLFAPEEAGVALTSCWRHAAPRAEFIPVPGNHRTCVTTHIAELGAALDRELRLGTRDSGSRTRV